MCLALHAVPVPATTLRQVDTRELTLESQDIVIGQVQDTRAHWNDAHTKIVTDVIVSVNQSLKGNAAGLITLTQLGGEVDGVRYDVPGCPTFHKGESSLFFVWRDGAGRAQVNAMAQGKFDIRTDAATGARTVQRSVPGFAARDVKTLRPLAAGQVAPPLSLDALVREVQRTLAEQPAH
jgi:hypothetical protein